MAFNLRKYGKVFETYMYGDKCTISRYETKQDIFGATKPDIPNVVYEDIKCKFSFVEKDNPLDKTESYMPVLKQITLFCSLDYDIKPGDLIKGYRIDNKTQIEQLIEGQCGLPNRFDTHQEIPIQIKGEN